MVDTITGALENDKSPRSSFCIATHSLLTQRRLVGVLCLVRADTGRLQRERSHLGLDFRVQANQQGHELDSHCSLWSVQACLVHAERALARCVGAATMNNTLCLSIFLGLVYFRNLSWNYSAEVVAILTVRSAVLPAR